MKLTAIVATLQSQRKELATQLAQLDAALAALTGRRKRGRPIGVARKKRVLSAAGRARIAAAQRARWKKVRAAKKIK